MPITIRNQSSFAVEVFVTTYENGGDDKWYTLEAGHQDTWGREKGWEVVGFKSNHALDKRTALYTKADSILIFKDFNNVFTQ
ncbi:hypothetical protein FIBSPDRAFT_865682 [Athelia psychrophila]|uniref:Uncharacterized protein n=1 Tax=Athelia psychrophila TaxID=1759441 RepID=A0A166FED7_9AGAM|nr:hypothetical protein FIBSPDRAFT_865682 [Fibularhizoctonia sp. CBS 109695]